MIALVHLVVNSAVVVVGRIGNLATFHRGQLGGLGRYRVIVGSGALGGLVGDPLLQQGALLHFIDVGEAHLVQVVVFRVRPVRRVVNEHATLVNLAPERTLLAAGSRIRGIVANDLIFFFDVLPRHQVFAGDTLAVVVGVHDVEVVIDFVDERLGAGVRGVLGFHAVDHVVVAVVQHVLRNGRVIRFPSEVTHQEGDTAGEAGVVGVLLGGGVQEMARDAIGIRRGAARGAAIGFAGHEQIAARILGNRALEGDGHLGTHGVVGRAGHLIVIGRVSHQMGVLIAVELAADEQISNGHLANVVVGIVFVYNPIPI